MKRISIPLFAAAFVAAGFVEQKTSGQSFWIGQNNVSASTNWLDTANWSTASSPASTQVQFGDIGSVGTAGVINNVVDSTIQVSGLSCTNNTGQFHTTLIPAGTTLTINGASTVGGMTVNGYTTVFNMAGGGTLEQNGNLTIGNNGSSSADQGTMLDLSALSNFVCIANPGTLQLGSGNRSGANFRLAAVSNYVNAATFNANTPSSSSSVSGTLTLGTGTNAFAVDTFNIAAARGNCTVNFAGSTGGLWVRGAAGGDSDRTTMTVGLRSASGSGGTTTGTLSLNDHPVDLKLSTLTLGQANNASASGANNGTGIIQFNTGIIDATTINMAVASANASFSVANGTITVGTNAVTSQKATLVASNISLVNLIAGSSATGNLNIFGGSVICSGSILKTTSAGAGNIAINGGTLSVSNQIGTVALPVTSFSITNGVLTLAASSVAIANVTTLNCGGTMNQINVTDIPVIAGYPAQFPVIKYAGDLGGTFNFGVGNLPASSPAYSGYISNNSAAGTIDLVVTGGPVPARVVSWSGATDGNWDTTTANWRYSGSPTIYNELDFVRFDDAASGTTAVNLTTALHPSSVTVSNQAKAYGFTGSGTLSGETGLTKDGSATLYITNSGLNDFTGVIAINAGTVQVGDGAGAGNISAGNINNNGSLRFNRADDVTLANTIAGSGSLSQIGSGTLIVSGANSFTGNANVNSGTLRVTTANALGATNGGTIISSGATLDVNAQNLGAEQVTVSGTGVGDAGAIINSGGQALNALRYVTLAGNTTFAGTGRWDIRGAPSTADPANAGLSTGGNAHNLTKAGANQISLVGVTVDPQLGDVSVQQGTLSLETATTGLGNPTKTLSVAAGASFQLYQLTNQLNKVISLTSDGATPSIINNSGANTIIGPITMLNDCVFNVNGTSLTLNGSLSGGQLTKSGSGALTIGGNATHAATVLNTGKLTLNGTHTGTITAGFTTIVAGTGVNSGFTDITGSLFPGETNVAGTMTLAGLTLEFGGALFIDLGPTTIVGSGSNDLVQVNGDLTVNGNTITINPQGLLQLGVPYRIINYTGNLIWNGDLVVSGPANYNFTVDTNTPGQIRVVASGGPPVWNGASASSSFWSDSGNWNGVAIQPDTTLYFAGNSRLNNTNDTASDTSYSGFVFDATAGAFTLNGNPVLLNGSIVNSSVRTQTVNLGLDISSSIALDGGSGRLVIGGGITNTASALTTLTLNGNGILTNLLNISGGGTNTVTLSSSNANWTLMDNASSAPMSAAVVLSIANGTFNVGSGSSAPVFTTTTVNGAPSDHQFGTVSGGQGTLNMVAGTLTTAARINTATALNSTSVVNQVGGTLNIGNQFQGANGGNAGELSIVNISGGTMNIGSAASPNSPFYLASRGDGVLNISGSGNLNCSVLDLARNAAGNSITCNGTVNLNGGTLAVTRAGTATANAQTGITFLPSATFNFNGGTLKARGSSSSFFLGSRTAPVIPIKAVVKVGGAIIDDGGFAITVGEPLLHDSALGGTADGGLVKHGVGTLTLSATNTYTGPTLVGEGTLAVTGITATGSVTVSNTATIAGTGTLGGNLTVQAGGTLAPGGSNAVGKLTVSGAVTLQGTNYFELNKSLSPAATNDQIVATGAISFGGTLKLVNLGTALQVGDAFKLFTAGGGLSGSFTIDGPASVTWNTSTLTTDGTIRVASVLNTTPTNITAIVSGNQLQLSWPADHTGWRLQVQTNTLSTGLGTNWVDVPGSTNVNSYNAPISGANGAVFFRMVYP